MRNTVSYDGNTVPNDGNTVPYDGEYSLLWWEYSLLWWEYSPLWWGIQSLLIGILSLLIRIQSLMMGNTAPCDGQGMAVHDFVVMGTFGWDPSLHILLEQETDRQHGEAVNLKVHPPGLLPLVRLHLLKVPQYPKALPAAGTKCSNPWSYGGWIFHVQPQHTRYHTKV